MRAGIWSLHIVAIWAHRCQARRIDLSVDVVVLATPVFREDIYLDVPRHLQKIIKIFPRCICFNRYDFEDFSITPIGTNLIRLEKVDFLGMTQTNEVVAKRAQRIAIGFALQPYSFQLRQRHLVR